MALGNAPRQALPWVSVTLALVLFVVPAFAASYTITVQTDASTYSGTQAITITGVVSPAPGPNTGVVVVVKSPNGAVVDIGDEAADAVTGAYKHVTVPGGNGNWTAGTYSVNATWGGPGGSASQVATFSYVVPLTTTTTTVACTSPIAIAATSTCTATVAGPKAALTGETVTFSVQSGGSGSVTLPSAPTCSLVFGVCSITVTGATAGSATIKASYPGDSNNAPSSGTGSLSVLASTTTTVNCTPTSVAVSATSSCIVTVTGTAGNVAGTVVTFSQASGSTGKAAFPSPASCTLTAGGTCSITVTGAAAGSVTVTAAYPGDANNGASSGSATVAVQAATTTTTSSSTTTSTTSTSTTTTQTSTSTTSTSSSATTSASTSTSSSGGGFGTLAYLAIGLVVAVVAVVGIIVWRRRVASDYGRKSTSAR
jgi:large repetitive protein